MLTDIQKKVQAILTENASAILTGVGVVGTVATAVLTGKAAAQAVTRVAEWKQAEEEAGLLNEPTKVDKVQMNWRFFVPPVAVGSATIVAIIMANRISAKRAAALAAAYGISQNQFDEYRKKAEEKLGLKKSGAVKDEIAQDRVDGKPVDKSVVIIGNGEVLCYDAYSDRYFKSSVENIKRAEAVVQHEILLVNECPLAMFYDELEIPKPDYSDMVGWNLSRNCVVDIKATVSQGNEPCIVVLFVDPPSFDYANGYLKDDED